MSALEIEYQCRRCGEAWTQEKKRGQEPYWCEPCRPAIKRERAKSDAALYRERHRDLIRARSRARYAANPDYGRDYAFRARYGITLADYDRIFESQGRKCALCPATECQTGRNMPVDHCHETGAIRGILCNLCNSTLLPGYENLPPELRDSPRINAYLTRGLLERDPLLVNG